MRTLARLGVLLIGLTCFGCGGDKTSTAPTTTTTGPATETFGRILLPGGATSRSFTASQSGTISVTLTSSGPPTNVALGLGVGIPTVAGVPCSLGVSINTVPGPTPQISVPADAGDYCVEVYDIGNLRDLTGFQVTINHP